MNSPVLGDNLNKFQVVFWHFVLPIIETIASRESNLDNRGPDNRVSRTLQQDHFVQYYNLQKYIILLSKNNDTVHVVG